MSTGSDAHNSKDAPAPEARHGFWGGVEDFLQSTVYSAIQKPIDGAEELIDHVTGKHLPELHIIDAPTDQNWETKVGSIAGTAIDVAAAWTGVGAALGAAGIVGEGATLSIMSQGAIKGAVTGFMVSSVQPESTSGSYWENKLKDVAIGTAGLAAAGAVVAPISAWLGESAAAKIASKGSANVVGNIAHGLVKDLLYLEKPVVSQILKG